MISITTRHKINTFFFNIRFRTSIVWKRHLRRFIVKKLNLNRPTYYPFITGDGFRALAQHILDENSSIDPHMVDDGDIVFVNADYLIDFFERMHPQIKRKYILITHNSDLNITREHIKYIDEKIIRWFAKNVLEGHEKVTPIPIGLVNTFCNSIGKTSDLPKIMKHTPLKEMAISFGFSLVSGKDRIFLHELLNKKSFSVHIAEKNQRIYFEKMQRCMFTASPEGNGADCHRTWEAIYLRTVPILTKNFFVTHFKQLGMPMLIIDDWHELEAITEQELEKLYKENVWEFDHPAMYMNYWIDLILKEKELAY